MTTAAPSTTRPTGPDPLPDRTASATVPGWGARLLGLVRGLIAFGQALIHTLQYAPTAQALLPIIGRFGTRDIALIVARITRGLLLAAHLDARLTRDLTQTAPPPPKRVRRRKRHAPAPAITQDADDAALLARLPTAREIAASVRGKPIGLVLEEICRDLGITCAHPLWRQVSQAILHHGGKLSRFLAGMQRRTFQGYAALGADDTAPPLAPPPLAVTSLALTSPALAATGPP